VPEPASIIGLGELSRPATVLIEKISDAVGGIFRPYQIRRLAEAEADAAVVQAKTSIQISDIQRRAMHRFLVEEGQKQENIESITQKALPYVASDAKPEDVETDWITNFFDKSRLVSDEDMQALWAKVLAGEANSPGSYSKRTVSLLSSMDKAEAELFRKLCSFVWQFGGLTPLIYDVLDPVYFNSGITFDSLNHLDLVGLITFDSLAGFTRTFTAPPETSVAPFRFVNAYYGTPYQMFFQSIEPFDVGKALLTAPGAQLASVAGSTPNEDFRSYILERWKVFQITPIEMTAGS
jgi:hypothetical protein